MYLAEQWIAFSALRRIMIHDSTNFAANQGISTSL